MIYWWCPRDDTAMSYVCIYLKQQQQQQQQQQQYEQE